PRFDRVFHDREGPSGVRPGDLEHHPHAAEPDRAALARLHDDRRHVHLQPLSSSRRKYSVPTATLHLPTARIENRVEGPKRLHQTAVTPVSSVISVAAWRSHMRPS